MRTMLSEWEEWNEKLYALTVARHIVNIITVFGIMTFAS